MDNLSLLCVQLMTIACQHPLDKHFLAQFAKTAGNIHMVWQSEDKLRHVLETFEGIFELSRTINGAVVSVPMKNEKAVDAEFCGDKLDLYNTF